jgi:quinol monooxygenase YgiN
MAAVWTHATWTVAPGREEEFIRLWQELAAAVKEELQVPDDREPTLLRDRERPNVFLSFGPWSGPDDVERFRGSEAFGRYVARMRELLESFDPRTLDEVSRDG